MEEFILPCFISILKIETFAVRIIMKDVLTDHDKKLYDRQIRLFGYDTQLKIKQMKVRIISKLKCNDKKFSYIGAEILKNFALIGVINLEFNKLTLDSYSMMVPNSLQEINENIIYSVIDEELFYKTDIPEYSDSGSLKNEVNILNNEEFTTTESNFSNKNISAMIKGIVDQNCIKLNNDSKDCNEKNKGFLKEEFVADEDSEEIKITSLNENLNRKTTKKLNLRKPLTIYINYPGKDMDFFLCTDCYSFNNKYHDKCNRIDRDPVVFECLLGAIFVQEIIKCLMEEDFQINYKIDI
ncbi:hypothetical protein EDEG_03018 [Edhazardia aedis USNM 41457]|uniref:Uncharacterized protein n=1 Tax=Edhazardia aedis (strain USNM 41457) TaxID=1003232 RepID=J9D4Y0_EDHAE|nr:hypothetical protein EDEG_03018 [Edhazardia aedis USNM 41457]|eukprot:EJW02579.1 hypothetical protein EDEG_03018 [Edhazardia aedis USNM 41457]